MNKLKDYSSQPDPEVWNRIEKTLRKRAIHRQMRSAAVAAVVVAETADQRMSEGLKKAVPFRETVFLVIKLHSVEVDDGRVFECTALASNAFPETVYFKLLDDKSLVSQFEKKKINARKYGFRAFSVSLGLDAPPEEIGIEEGGIGDGFMPKAVPEGIGAEEAGSEGFGSEGAGSEGFGSEGSGSEEIEVEGVGTEGNSN